MESFVRFKTSDKTNIYLYEPNLIEILNEEKKKYKLISLRKRGYLSNNNFDIIGEVLRVKDYISDVKNIIEKCYATKHILHRRINYRLDDWLKSELENVKLNLKLYNFVVIDNEAKKVHYINPFLYDVYFNTHALGVQILN